MNESKNHSEETNEKKEWIQPVLLRLQAFDAEGAFNIKTDEDDLKAAS